MHVSFDESNPSKEDNIVCNDNDDEILEGPQENTSKDQPIQHEESPQQE